MSVVATADGRYLCELLGKDFTDEQLAVITADLGPQLVVAGAGSGKTTVMAARVVHAIAWFGIPADRILGVTFTNKAAAELAERVRHCISRLPSREPSAVAEGVEDLPTVSTYNSYAAQIVRDHALRIGREPGATLLTEAVQWQLAMRVASRAPGPFPHLDWTTSYVAEQIVALAGELSDHLATPEDVRRHDAAVREAAATLAKPLKWVKEMVERTLSRDELLTLVSAYQEEKARLDLIDFGDQVALACRIVQAAPEVAVIERERYRLVVLDEYQDTGVSQRMLFAGLFGAGHAITAVGDPNQAIYGWRGAAASNLSRFAEHFDPRPQPSAPMPLMTTFRCDGRILDAANAVAAPLDESMARKSRSRIDVPRLRATAGRTDAGQVVVTRVATAADEADWLAERVAGAIRSGTPAGEIAVLGRRRTDFPRLHHAMAARDIPVEVVGLGGLLAMPEVSDIVAVLSLLADTTSNAAAVRLLTGPRWRIGVRDLAALGRRAGHLARLRAMLPAADGDAGAEAAGEDLRAVADEPSVTAGVDAVLAQATSTADPVEAPSLLEAIESPGDRSGLSAEAAERLDRFMAEIRRLRRLVGQPLVDLVTEVIATTGLDVEIEASERSIAAARSANIHAFLDVAAQFNGIDGEADLVAFIAYLRAAADNERGLDLGAVSPADTVKLMTIHAAKGLEWDVVAVPGLVEGVFPPRQSRSHWITGAQTLPFACRGDREDLPELGGFETADFDAFKAECRSDAIDEERRLAYVAFTRARHALWLSAYSWIGTRKDPCPPSPFLTEVLELGEPVITVDGWQADPEDGATNPILDEGVADVDWPVMTPADEAARRRAAAELVEQARRAAPQLALPSGEAAEIGEAWLRDTGLLIDEARRRRNRVVEVAVPPRLTTSQVVALARDEDAFAASLARPLPSRPAPQARRGSRFHRWVEELYGAAPLLEPDDLPGASDEELSDEELADLQQRFLDDGWGERRPVAVEAPFEMVVGHRMLRGRIDAVYPTAEGGFDVIDYKTGAKPSGREFDAAALQLSIYRLAWADLAGVDPGAVNAGFLYVRNGTLVRPEKLLSREELAAVLNG
ncbi:MAG TPA: ATP-dependent DNA helicase [Mycobacteriales bacterium]|nr:ATP-dependent DNA helicase [Mycobacteriales bacterium]